jgi:Carboxypeptidase regulatory-like domain
MSFRWLATTVAIAVPIVFVTLTDRLAAQNTTSGAITGVVTDSTAAVMQDAHVELKDNAKGTAYVSSTDAEGRYVFSFLRPGRYTLVVSKEGFSSETQNLDVFLGPPVTLNVRLLIATRKFSVTVSVERPLIQAENGDVSSTIGEQEVAEVPNPGNDLTYIAQTTPGTVMNTEGTGGGNFSNMGISAFSNLFTVNGMYDNIIGPSTNESGALNLLLGANEVQEATVVTNGYSGQFGDVAGASVNYITKSGGNSFHGNAVYGWNGRVLNANGWINKASGNARPFDNVNQWAGSFGGPIKKEKLFFFFNTEGVRLLLPQSFDVGIPSPQFEAATLANIDARFGATSPSDGFYRQIFNLYNTTPGADTAKPGAFSEDPLGCAGFVGPNGLGRTVPCSLHFIANRGRPTDESLTSGRIDWDIRTSDRAFLLVQYDRGHQATYTDAISPLFNIDSDQPWWQGQLNETHSFGTNTANQLLIAAWAFRAVFTNPDRAQTLAAFPTVIQMGAIGTLNDLGGQDDFAPAGSSNTQLQITDDVMKTSGNHKLGFGGNLVREDWSNFVSQNVIGVLSPQTLTAFYQGGVDPGVFDGTDPNPDFTLLRQAFQPQGTQHRFTVTAVALYAQDEWHPRPDLSVSFGLRAEHEGNPTCSRRCYARLSGPFDSIIHDPSIGYNQVIAIHQLHPYSGLDKVLWAPRFSFAWQPLGVAQDTVLRGGFGLFYDLAPRIGTALFANNPPLRNLFTATTGNLTPNEVNSLFAETAASEAAFLSGFASGRTFGEIQAEIPNFDPPAFNNPGPRTHASRYQKWSLDLQQTIGKGTSVSLGYYGNHGIHEFIRNDSVNAFGFGTLPPALCTSPPVLPCADPRFSQVTEITTVGVSNYNGLIATVQHKFKEGVLRANYTWSHAFDESSNDGFGFFTNGNGDPQPQDPRNPRGSYGPAEYDVRHYFNASYVWEVPFKAALRGHGRDALLKGWQVAGTVFARTGFPFTVVDVFQSNNLQGNNYFGAIYAVPVSPAIAEFPCGRAAAVPNATKPCFPPEALPDGTPNPSAVFLQPGCETGFNTGNLPSPTGPCGGPAVTFTQGRNRFRGPHYFNTDLAIMKNTKLGRSEGVTLGLGAQFFNVLNHPNFQLPDNGLPFPTFGQFVFMAAPPTTLLGAGLGGDASARMIELKVRVQF